MKKSIVILTTIVVLVFAGPALHAQEAVQATPAEFVEVSPVFSRFVNALQAGNVRMLKNLLSEEMYSEYRILLEENKEYPRFLERYYDGADFQLENIIREGNDLHGLMRVTFPGGDTSVLRINVKKKNGNAPWRIGRVLHEKMEKKSSILK